jgi:hypothetical protein
VGLWVRVGGDGENILQIQDEYDSSKGEIKAQARGFDLNSFGYASVATAWNDKLEINSNPDRGLESLMNRTINDVDTLIEINYLLVERNLLELKITNGSKTLIEKYQRSTDADRDLQRFKVLSIARTKKLIADAFDKRDCKIYRYNPFSETRSIRCLKMVLPQIKKDPEFGRHLMYQAIDSSDSEGVEILAQAGVEVSKPNPNREESYSQALRDASGSSMGVGNHGMVYTGLELGDTAKVLIKHGWKVDWRQINVVLDTLILHGHTDAALTVLKAHTEIDPLEFTNAFKTLLIMWVQNDKASRVALLKEFLSRGLTVIENTYPISLAIEKTDVSALREFVAAGVELKLLKERASSVNYHIKSLQEGLTKDYGTTETNKQFVAKRIQALEENKKFIEQL